MLINLASGSYPAVAKEASDSKLVNFYITENKTNPIYPYIITPSPGLTSYISTFTSPIRGMMEKDGVAYLISGNTFYKVTSDLTISTIGTFNNRDTYVNFTTSFDNILASDGNDAYSYNFNTSTWMSVTDPTFPLTTPTITCIKTFFFACTGKTVYFSASEDPQSWDALDFISSDSTQETINVLGRVADFLILAGSTRTEFYQVVGGSGVVKAMTGILIPYGCRAKRSFVEGEKKTFFLGISKNSGHSIFQIDDGLEYKRISTPQLDAQINNYSYTDDAIAFTYVLDGCSYYQITFPTANKTWLYDIDLMVWSELQSEYFGQQGRHRANLWMSFNSLNIVSDFSNSVLYKLDPNVFTDDGTAIQRFIRLAPVLSKDNRNERIIKRIEVDIQKSIGLASGQGSDPIILLRKSGDGGNTYGGYIESPVVGVVGDGETRALYNNLGRARNMVLELTMTDPVNWCILGIWAYIDDLSE